MESPPDFAWARIIGGTNYDVNGDLAIDREGNVHVSGFATLPNMFSSEVPPAGTNLGSFFVAKADPDGRVIWSDHGVAGSSVSVPTFLASNPGVAVDAAGNVCFTGWFANSIQFGSMSLKSRGGMDLFVVKYDRSGKPVWAHRIGGIESEETGDIAVDATGGVYMLGGFRGPASLDDTELPLYSGPGFFVANFDAQGKLQWIQEGRGSMTYQYMAADPQGNTVVAGVLYGRPITIGTNTLTAGSPYGTFFAKFDSQGKFLWAKTHSVDLPRVALDRSGDAYLAGRYPTQTAQGLSSQLFIAKYGVNGDLLWTNRASGFVDWVA